MKCKTCNSSKVTKKAKNFYANEKFGKKVLFKAHVEKCSSCKAELVCNDYDKNFLKAFYVSREDAKNKLLKALKKKYSKDVVKEGERVELERIFGMPADTLTELETREATPIEFNFLLLTYLSPVSLVMLDSCSDESDLKEYIKIQDALVKENFEKASKELTKDEFTEEEKTEEVVKE